MIRHLQHVTITLSTALLLNSSSIFASGVDEPSAVGSVGVVSEVVPIHNNDSNDFKSYGGTVQSLIDKKRQDIIPQAPTPASGTPPTNKPETTFYPPVVFVGMYEKEDGDRIAEVYFRGNILQYRKKEQLPNKEVITYIDERVLTTNQQKYWLSPTPVAPETFNQPQVPLPLGLIQ